MSRQMKMVLIVLFALFLIVVAWPVFEKTPNDDYHSPDITDNDLTQHTIYSNYDFRVESRVVDIGVQPMWVPTCMITEVMKRDAILREELSSQGLEIRFHSFLKGADVNFFLDRGDLEVAIGGDMPALTAAAKSEAVVTSLIQHGFCSIVAKRHMLMSELRGMRIAYAFGSNAHYALLQALTSAGLTEEDVRMVSLDVNEMPTALEDGRIDAFSAWEPMPTIAITRHTGKAVIHRSITSGFMYFSYAFAERYPETVRQIVASELRAIDWLKQTAENGLEAADWKKSGPVSTVP